MPEILSLTMGFISFAACVCKAKVEIKIDENMEPEIEYKPKPENYFAVGGIIYPVKLLALIILLKPHG